MKLPEDWVSVFNAHKWRQYAKEQTDEDLGKALRKLANALRDLADPIKFMERNDLPRQERFRKGAADYGYFTDGKAAFRLRPSDQKRAKKMWGELDQRGIDASSVFDKNTNIPATIVDLGFNGFSLAGKVQSFDGKRHEWIPAEYIIALSANIPFGTWCLDQRKERAVALWMDDKIVGVVMPLIGGKDAKLGFRSIMPSVEVQHVA